MAKQRFKIKPFTNPSGKKVWRLSGTLYGERIRRNYSSRDEAVAQRQKLTAQYLNSESKGHSIWTTLTAEQNREAVVAFSLMKKAKTTKSLSFACLLYTSDAADD